MVFAAWAALLAAGIVSGMCMCAAFVARGRLMWLWALAATLSASGLLVAGLAAWGQTRRIDAFIAVLFLSVGAWIGGFALCIALIPKFTSRSRAPRPIVAVASPVRSEIGVIVLSDAEPSEYDPSCVTAMLQKHERYGAPLPPEFARPFVYASERARYARVGGSPARGQVREIAGALKAELDGAGVAAEVLTAFATGRPNLRDAVAGVAAMGDARVIVTPLSVALTRALSEAIDSITPRELTDAGLALDVARPVWASDAVSSAVAGRILASIQGAKDSVGVCLAESGAPSEVERANPAAIEQTTFFAERVRAELISAGITAERVKRAWVQWESPDILEAARHLAAVGVDEIVLAPVSAPVETIETLIDLRYAAAQATGYTGTRVTIVDPWGSDAGIVRDLAQRVSAVLGESDATLP